MLTQHNQQIYTPTGSTWESGHWNCTQQLCLELVCYFIEMFTCNFYSSDCIVASTSTHSVTFAAFSPEQL